MKKLFTLVALLAVFMGAKAEWVEDYKIDYSNNTGFPFYVNRQTLMVTVMPNGKMENLLLVLLRLKVEQSIRR